MSREFRTDIQALRGLAVLLVVLYHADVSIFSAGYLGVDVFFVISGFLITGLIRSQLDQASFSLWDFYYRRVKRLLPAAYAVIALTTIAAPFFLSEIGLREFRYQVLGALTFTGNIVLWFQSDYFAEAAGAKPLLHIWSLAIEEQYYLLLPAFLLLVPKRLHLAFISSLLVISLIACFFLAPRNPSAAFYLLPTRFWEMAIGSLGALLPAHSLLRAKSSMLRLPALGILVAIPVFPFDSFHPGINALLVCAATLVLLLARTSDSISIRSFAKVGDLSYSLYLIHWPVLVLVKATWFPEPPAFVIYSAILVSLIASWALHRFVEEPFRRGSFPSRIWLISGMAAASVLLSLAPWALNATSTSKTDFKKIRQANFGLGLPCAFKPSALPTDLPKECQTIKDPKMLVWGDSYAMALASGLARTAGEIGVAQLTMSSCGPFIGVAVFVDDAGSRYPRSFAESCIQFNDRVLTILKSQPNIEVVAITGMFSSLLPGKTKLLVRHEHAYTEEAPRADLHVLGIKALVDEVRTLGKRVVLIAPPPSSGINVGDCLERKMKGYLIFGEYSRCEIPFTKHVEYQAGILSMLNQLRSEAGVEIISLGDFLCDRQSCKTEINGKFVYRDNGHLSYEGSEIVARRHGLVERLLRLAR